MFSETNITAQASSIGGKKQSLSTDYMLKVLGLDICAETLLGNDMHRGISGGQKKRVTTGNRIWLFVIDICTCTHMGFVFYVPLSSLIKKQLPLSSASC